MKRLLAIGLTLFVLGMQSVWSAGPGLPQLLRATGEQEEKRVDVVPDPAQLRADWWLYFAVPRDELVPRVQAAKDLLDRRYRRRSAGADSEQVAAAIDQIKGQLDAFVAASQLQPAEPRPAPPVAEHYTPAEALKLVAALRKARVELDFEVSEVAATIDALRSTLEQVDRTMASYLRLTPGTPQRLDSGFSIMIERSAAAVTAEQLRLRRAALERREDLMTELADVERFAEQNLTADLTEIDRLEQRITGLQEHVHAAQERALVATRRMLEPVGNELVDQFAARYRQQRSVLAEIDLASHETRLAGAQAQLLLTRMLIDQTVALDEASDSLDALRERVDVVSGNANKWRAASERERGRAGERVAERSGRESVDAAALINQDRVRLAQQSINELRTLDEELLQLDYLVRWINQAILNRQGFIGRAVGEIGSKAAMATEFVGSITDRSLFKLGETPITLSAISQLVIVIVIAWLVSWVLRRILNNIARRFPKDNQALMFVISRLAHYVIIGIGLIAGLSSIGLNLTSFALVAGALALGLGFGLQSIVNNFLSGLILFFERSIKVGDFIQLDNGERGEVKAINVRGTVVNTNDNIDVVVPNSEFIERKVINWTLLDPFRRIHVPFRVAYESDEDKVVEAGLDAASRLSSTLTGVLGREPSVWLVNYGENGLDFELIVWLMPDAVKRPDAVYAAYHWEIRKALRRHQIEVPVPQREIRFRGAMPETLDREAGR